MVFIQELESLNQADDQENRDKAQRGSIDRLTAQLPIDQQGQDRESQEYVEDEHSYYPFGSPRPHWRRTLPTVTSPRYDREADLDIPV
jgi:hypothetical protein